MNTEKEIYKYIKKESKITSLQIKHALMYYFRFKRQWICASECNCNDVMAITDKDVIEVEIKVNKYDLWRGEEKKRKHKMYNEFTYPYWKYYKHSVPNRFYICVPLDLEEEAKKWIEEVNPKYGAIRYHPNCHVINSITMAKTARTLKKEVYKGVEKEIMMRVCSENIGLIGRILNEEKRNI